MQNQQRLKSAFSQEELFTKKYEEIIIKVWPCVFYKMRKPP